MNQKESIPNYIAKLWDRRSFTWEEAKARAFRSARGTILGRVWLVLNPFANALVFYIIFGVLLQISRGIPNFLGYLVIGVNFFALFRDTLTKGGNILPQSRRLLRAYVFPKASVVISWSMRTFLDFLPVLFSTLLFVMLLPPHVAPNWRWALLIPLIFITFLFVLGLALFTAAWTSVLADLKFIWPLIGRFWFYISGVFFAMSRFDSLPKIKALMEANPGYVFLTMSRDLIIYETVPSLAVWIYFLAWSLLLLGIGFLCFWLFEENYGNDF